MASRFVNRDDSCKARVTVTRALHHSARRAFTLLEVTLVIVILAIVAAIAIPRIADSNSLYRVETAAKRVESDIKMAQDLSRSLSLPHQVVFATGSSRYVVEPAGATSTRLAIATTGARVTDLSPSPFKARVMRAAFGSGKTLTFDAFGAPVDAGAVVVYAGDWGAMVRVKAGLGLTDITLFRISHPPASTLAAVGAMDTVTRGADPAPTATLLIRTDAVSAGISVNAIEISTPGLGNLVTVNTQGL